MRYLSPLLVLACVACSTPDPCADDPTHCQDAGKDGPDGLGSCAGVCLPHAPAGWLATSLLWIGKPSDTPPACPSVLSGTLPGFADTLPTVSCPACKCSPSSGECLLPVQLSANLNACPGGSGGQQFDAPKAWDGTCDTSNPISSADSLTASPPPSPGGGCSPVVTGQINIQGTTPALVCSGTPSVAPGTCGDQDMVCAFPKTDGFLTCITNVGDQKCPASWTTRHLVYLNSQACGCQCSSPVGDSCSASITVYEDGACSNPLGSVMVSSEQPNACVDVTPGSAFKSKSSTPPVYKSGICTPSTFDEGEPFTVCCAP
jgi:hypothetical protein